jgi:bacteriocin resistance YdeI/OmpD-like protein
LLYTLKLFIFPLKINGSMSVQFIWATLQVGLFSTTTKKEYVTWATETKTEATQQSRLETAIEWMSEGKVRNWKYQKK